MRWIGGSAPAEDRLEAGPALALRRRAQVVVAEREQVPRDEATTATRSASIATRDAAGWMRSSSASKSSAAVAGDDDLAVEDAAVRAARPGAASASSGK